MGAEDKAERILAIYTKLKTGRVVYKLEESKKYGVSPRTIQRDISDIQCFLDNQKMENGEIHEILFDKKLGGYCLKSVGTGFFESKEILAVCKVLLESRSLVKAELFPIIQKLIDFCNPIEEQKRVKELVSNEMFHYIELQHRKQILDILWVLEQAVKEQKFVALSYKKMKNQELVERKVKPVGIMFSEFYFYLTAYIDGIDKKTEFRNPDDAYPTIYRVDRIESVKVLEERFVIPYADRFEEGEFRKRVQFMYGGRLRTIKFKCKESALEAILDRFPTAEVIAKEDDRVIVKAEVFGDGVDMWLQGQGKMVEIIS